MGMVEFLEPAAAAKAVRAWHNKRPYSKGMIARSNRPFHPCFLASSRLDSTALVIRLLQTARKPEAKSN